MSTIQESDFGRVEPERARVDARPGAARHGRQAEGPTPRVGSAGGDLVVPVDPRLDMEPALEHSVRLARAYHARVVLVYVTNERPIPHGYAMYARAEGIRDYGAAYLNSLGDEAIGELKGRIEEMGLECSGYTYLGTRSQAMRAVRQNPRLLMTVLTVSKESVSARLGLGMNPGALARGNAPVLFIPAEIRKRG